MDPPSCSLCSTEALTGMLTYARLKNKSLAVDSLALMRYEALPQAASACKKDLGEIHKQGMIRCRRGGG